MLQGWSELKDFSVIGNGLKGFSVGLLCNIYFFGKINLEKLFEAIALWFRASANDLSSELAIRELLSEAGQISAMSHQMLESGYLIAGLLVLISCTLVGLWDGVRERRFRELQKESETRLRRLREAQEVLTDVQRRLAHSERLAAVGRIAASVSHEINNPLAAVSGHIRLLAMQIPEQDTRRPLLDVMQKETRRIRDIVRGMNDFARHQPDPGEIRKNTADVHEIVNDTLAAFGPRLSETNVKVVREFDSRPTSVFGKKDHIRIALNNLIANAIEAMPASGTLTVKTNRSSIDRYGIMVLKGFSPTAHPGLEAENGPDRILGVEGEFSQPLMLKEGDPVIRVSIADTGVGIDPELMKKIFEPFVTTKEIGYGLGLGLAITYSIVRSHGGYIEVKSEKNKGSEFTVVLAAGPASATPESAPHPSNLVASTSWKI